MKKFAILNLPVVLLVCSLIYTSTLSSSQDVKQARAVTEVNWGHEPIEVTDLRLYEKPIAFDRPFISTDDAWMRGLSFKVKNTSNKSITYLNVGLRFPLKDSPRPAYYIEPLEYGKGPAPRHLEKMIQPGETIQLTCDSVDVESLTRVVKARAQGEYLKINKVSLSTELVTFEDKTTWTAGVLLRFDESIKKWIEVSNPQNKQGAVDFAKTTYISPLRPVDCYKPTIMQYDCTAGCGSGGTKNLPEPGDPGTNVKPADAQYRCNTTCVLLYTGTAPCT